MVKTFLFVFLIFLAIMGVCELIYIIRMLFYFPHIRTKSYSVIILKCGCAVKQLDYFYQKIKWYGDSFAQGVIAVIDDIDISELSDCINFVKGKNFVLCTSEHLSAIEQLQRS